MDVGTIIFLLAIGAMFLFMMKGGGCCGGHKKGDTGQDQDPQAKKSGSGCH